MNIYSHKSRCFQRRICSFCSRISFDINVLKHGPTVPLFQTSPVFAFCLHSQQYMGTEDGWKIKMPVFPSNVLFECKWKVKTWRPGSEASPTAANGVQFGRNDIENVEQLARCYAISWAIKIPGHNDISLVSSAMIIFLSDKFYSKNSLKRIIFPVTQTEILFPKVEKTIEPILFVIL